ncbi:hypothetical protein CANCADRAFT_17177, partial [Tortispora caseinolytica NRRL Y-17796]
KNIIGIVDIASNGLRVSITSLNPETARIMPILFQDRLAISVFEETHSKPVDEEAVRCSPEPFAERTIPNHVINELSHAMARCKLVCTDFGVDPSNIKVVAAEIVGRAVNFKDFSDCVYETSKLRIEVLSCIEESTIGVLGVASSFHDITGLYIDLGVASAQLSWAQNNTGEISMCEKPAVLDFGTDNLIQRLYKEDYNELRAETIKIIKDAFAAINVPSQIVSDCMKDLQGFKLYASGGGFRSFGSLMLSDQLKSDEYPMQIINGFACTADRVKRLLDMAATGLNDPRTMTEQIDQKFRVSGRIAVQLPAVIFFISCLWEALPPVSKILFSQGGVREGHIFKTLPRDIRVQDPIITATKAFAPRDAEIYSQIVLEALPLDHVPPLIKNRILPALVNMSFYHTCFAKESQAISALVVATTGPIAATHGLSHEIRALVGIGLCERWGGEIADTSMKRRMRLCITEPMIAWWATCLGKLLYLICTIYPAG